MGKSFELEVPVPQRIDSQAAIHAMEEAYGAEHERTYGHRAGANEPVELVTLKVIGTGLPDVARRGRGEAKAGQARRDRRGRSARLFRPSSRLAGNARAGPRRPCNRPARAMHHRGI